MKKKKNKQSRMYYLNHKNLIGEIENYGYVFRFRQLLFTYLCVISGCMLAGRLYKLPIYGYAVIIVFALLQTPFLVRNYYGSLYEQRRFSDASKYAERMLYYFKAKGKVLDALTDVEKVFPDGHMKQCIHEAVSHIRNTVDKNAIKDALEMIEHEYSCNRIRRLHAFMLQIEEEGGNPETGTEMLLRDRQIWTDTEVMYRKDKRNVKMCGMVSIVLAMGMCLITLYIPNIFAMKMLDISKNSIVQFSAVVMILYFLHLYATLDKKMCVNRLDDRKNDDDKILKIYRTYLDCDVKKEIRKIFPWIAGLLTAAAVASVLFKSLAVFIAGLTVVLIITVYPVLNHRAAGKFLRKEIKEQFPVWIIQLGLQMQNSNVVMSVVKTYETAPAVLKTAIEKFISETEKAPEAVEPYNGFLSEFNIPEINEIMGTLYSVSTGSGADPQTEFKEIMKRNYEMLEKSEKQKNDDKTAVMKNIYISKPAMAAGFKLLADMTVMLLTFFANTMEML